MKTKRFFNVDSSKYENGILCNSKRCIHAAKKVTCNKKGKKYLKSYVGDFLFPEKSLADPLIMEDFRTIFAGRNESFGIFPNIYKESLLRKMVIMVSVRGMLSVELTVFRSI